MIDAENWSWATLRTYEDVLAEQDPEEADPVDDRAAAIAHALRYGG